MKCQYWVRIGWFSPRLAITSLMMAGVASRPASWWATVVTGRAKNRKNDTVATNQTTMIPVKTRRIR